MKQVSDHELSGLLDGELDPRRADEVRALIRNDAALSREYEALASLDARLSRAADETAFAPATAFPADASRAARSWYWPLAIAGVPALVAIRILPKLVDLSLLGLVVQFAAFAAIAVMIVRMARDATSPSLTFASGPEQ